MTLSRFPRDYLYFGLGGNRKGPVAGTRICSSRCCSAAVARRRLDFLIWGGVHGCPAS
jgi:D-alanyl-lipoteichoic acid acyltransferase DltB (MBOAT superfamily)